jgi:hypothetical protein
MTSLVASLHASSGVLTFLEMNNSTALIAVFPNWFIRSIPLFSFVDRQRTKL